MIAFLCGFAVGAVTAIALAIYWLSLLLPKPFTPGDCND